MIKIHHSLQMSCKYINKHEQPATVNYDIKMLS